MSLLSLRDAIVQRLASEVPQLVSVEAHDGDFTLEEIKRHFGHHPRAARVVCLGLGTTEDIGGQPVAPARWAVFVACRQQGAGDPDGAISPGDACTVLATRIVELAHEETWNGQAFRVPQNISARNLYTGRLSKHGLSLWAVEWEQPIVLDGRTATDLDRLALIHTDYDVGSGPDHATDTEFPEPEES
ncbi:MAG: hypothetical protein ACODAG_07340 [Myxococcota bacterium]